VYGKLESGALHELSDSTTGSFSNESEILVEDRRPKTTTLLLFFSINFIFFVECEKNSLKIPLNQFFFFFFCLTSPFRC
jgi:hypothetical protein